MIIKAHQETEHLQTPTPQPERKGKMKEAPPHLTPKPTTAPKEHIPTPTATLKAATSYATAAAKSKPTKQVPQGASKAKA